MTIASPCSKVCTLDAASGLCLGCGRTAQEIGAWALMPNQARLAIVAELADRLASRGLAPSGSKPSRGVASAVHDTTR